MIKCGYHERVTRHDNEGAVAGGLEVDPLIVERLNLETTDEVLMNYGEKSEICMGVQSHIGFVLLRNSVFEEAEKVGC